MKEDLLFLMQADHDALGISRVKLERPADPIKHERVKASHIKKQRETSPFAIKVEDIPAWPSSLKKWDSPAPEPKMKRRRSGTTMEGNSCNQCRAAALSSSLASSWDSDSRPRPRSIETRKGLIHIIVMGNKYD